MDPPATPQLSRTPTAGPAGGALQSSAEGVKHAGACWKTSHAHQGVGQLYTCDTVLGLVHPPLSSQAALRLQGTSGASPSYRFWVQLCS